MSKTVVMNSTYISMVNGEFADTIPVNDRGLAFGDGVFETLRLENGRFPFLPFHLHRLQNSCERLSISLDLNQLQNSLIAFQSYLADLEHSFGVVKIIVTRGYGGRGVIPPIVGEQTATQILSFRQQENLTTQWLQNPVELVLSDYILPRNPALAGMKHLNRLDYVLAASRCPLRDNQQLVLMDVDRLILETLHHNIFCAFNGELVTPSLDTAGVNGVARRLITEHIAPELGVNVTIRPLPVDELNRADEIFLTNAVVGIVPVGKVDDRNLSRHDLSKLLGKALQNRAFSHAS